MRNHNFYKKIAWCTDRCSALWYAYRSSTGFWRRNAEKYTNTDFAMDTVVSETLYTTEMI